MQFDTQLRALSARMVPITLVDGAIEQTATVRQIADTLLNVKPIVATWDCVNGLVPDGGVSSVNYPLATSLMKEGPDMVDAFSAIRYIASEVLPRVRQDPTTLSAAFIFYTGDRVLTGEYDSFLPAAQQLMLMRDQLSDAQSMILFVGSEFKLEPELREQVKIINAPMPDEDDIRKSINEAYHSYSTNHKPEYGEKQVLDSGFLDMMVESLKGISEFQVQQTLYLSMDREGFHLDLLRQNAVASINKTKGLAVHLGNGQGFDALGGLDAIKNYSRRLLDGKLRVKLVVYMDELEKSLAGSGGTDTSGVSQNFLGTILSEMQDMNSLGMLLTGVYGSGKSAFAKAFGEEAGAITIHFDLSGMKDSLVGSSETNLRQAMSVIRSIGGTDGGVLFIATSNRIAQLPPELKRRFNIGTFFFNLPSPEERAKIWNIYLAKYDLAPERVDDTGWTGAEIESCCRLADLMCSSLVEASHHIVPVSVTARAEIQQLVDQADGRYLCASNPGTFTKAQRTEKSTGRKVNL